MITRLGLSATSRGSYGSFEAKGERNNLTRLGLGGFARGRYGSFTGKAANDAVGGGRPKRRYQSIQLPDGTVIEVDSARDAQLLLNQYYAAYKPAIKAPKIVKHRIKADAKQPYKPTVVYTLPKVRPLVVKDVISHAIATEAIKRKTKKRHDEEALLLLIA